MTDDGIGLSLDYEGYLRDLDEIGRAALPEAAAGMLNNAAFAAQRRLTAHVADVFDRPKDYTARAFMVRKANPRQKESMASQVFAKSDQAKYLKLQITGGIRRTGDVGSGPFDLFTYSVRKDRYGGVPRHFAKALTAEKRKEKTSRMLFGASRQELRLKHQLEMDRRAEAAEAQRDSVAAAERKVKANARLAAAMFTGSSYRDLPGGAFRNAKAREKAQRAFIRAQKERAAARLAADKASAVPEARFEAAPTYERTHSSGIFFGTIGGATGYWRRPKRTAPKTRRQRGVTQVMDTATPTLLLRVSDTAEYAPRFDERLDEVQRGWVRARVPRHQAAPPTLEPPAAQAFSLDELVGFGRVSEEDEEAAYDAGWSDYSVAAGESDEDRQGRPVPPVLSERWKRGWREANAEHQARHADWVARAGKPAK